MTTLNLAQNYKSKYIEWMETDKDPQIKKDVN